MGVQGIQDASWRYFAIFRGGTQSWISWQLFQGTVKEHREHKLKSNQRTVSKSLKVSWIRADCLEMFKIIENLARAIICCFNAGLSTLSSSKIQISDSNSTNAAGQAKSRNKPAKIK